MCLRAQPASGGYTITPLYFIANALNASGQVAGYGASTNGQTHAFLYAGGQTLDLGTLPGGSSSEALALNSLGQVVGDSTVSGGATHAFLYANGQMTDLGTLPRGYSSYATGINDAGQIVGWSDTTPAGYSYPRPDHAFLYSAGQMEDLGSVGTLFATWSHAMAINASGQVAGWSDTDNGGGPHAFLYTSGVMRDLGTLGGDQSRASAINASGQVVGWSSLAQGYASHAFLYSGGVMSDLGTLTNQSNSYAAGINSVGQVAGYSTSTGNGPAFLHSIAGGLINLSTQVGDPNWSVGGAVGINDAGQVLCAANNFALDPPALACILTSAVSATSTILSRPTLLGSVFQVTVSSIAGTSYTLESTGNLSATNWVTTQSATGTGGAITLTDANASAGARFYRVRAQ
ncbi:MAG: DUF3466 family protein [Verrucomicrobia bacterium]|nr:DUF3466 family protein [Verrucomicrobiota bacterium]